MRFCVYDLFAVIQFDMKSILDQEMFIVLVIRKECFDLVCRMDRILCNRFSILNAEKMHIQCIFFRFCS